MASDYFILVLIASIGLYQIVAITAKLDGLCFFKRPLPQIVFGALLIAGAYIWFFTSDERNIQHTVEGSQQLGLFLGAIVVGYVVTGILASAIQAKVRTRVNNPEKEKAHAIGIESLKTNTFLGSIRSRMRKEDKKG